MRRSIIVAASALALAAAAAVGPFGLAAAAPYVYGCTPATMYGVHQAYYVILTVYNGSASTASLTIKILAGNGAVRTSAVNAAFPTSLPATHTSTVPWVTPADDPPVFEADGTVPASVRIVSSAPVSATLDHLVDITAHQWYLGECTPQQP